MPNRTGNDKERRVNENMRLEEVELEHKGKVRYDQSARKTEIKRGKATSRN